MMFLRLRGTDGAVKLVNMRRVAWCDTPVGAHGATNLYTEIASYEHGWDWIRVHETLDEIEEIINHAAGRPGVWSLERVREDRRRVAEEMIRRSEMTRRRFEEIGIGNHLPEAVPDDVDDEPFNAAAVDRALCRDEWEPEEEGGEEACPACGSTLADPPVSCFRCGETGT